MPPFRLTEVAPFYRAGPLTSGEPSPGSWPAFYPAIVVGVLATLDRNQLPPDRDVIIDILVNGVSAFASDTSKRPRIPAGQRKVDWSAEANNVTIRLLRLDEISITVVQAGLTNPGHNLAVGVEYSFTG